MANNANWYTNFPEQFVFDKPDKFFIYSLFSAGSVSVEQDWENMELVGDIQGSLSLYGQMNESVSALNGWNYFTSLRVNGVETDINTVPGSTYELDTLYEFDFVYDNIIVNETIETSNELTIGYVTNDMWQNAPSLSFFQIRDEDGKLTNNIFEREGAKLYLVGPNCQYQAWVASQESDEWALLESEGTGDMEYYGKLIAYDLAQYDFIPNKWYKFKVCLTNDTGCFTKQTINYALYYEGTTNIDGTYSEGESDNEYYDLCGRKVENPSSGIYIKVSKSNPNLPNIEKIIIR